MREISVLFKKGTTWR